MAAAANPAVRRALARVLAAVGVWAALGASAAGGETACMASSLVACAPTETAK